MAVTAERWAAGMTMDEYEAQMSENRERFADNYATAPITAEDLAAFRAAEPLRVLVVTEDWCGDSFAHVPVLFRLAREAGSLDVRVLKRDGNWDIANAYPRPEGRVAIPIIVFFDREMRERGRFLERPPVGDGETAAFLADFFGRHPQYGTADTPKQDLTTEARQALMVELLPWHKSRMAVWNRDAIDLFKAIVAAPVPA